MAFEMKERTFKDIGRDNFEVEVGPGNQWVKIKFEAEATRLIFQFTYQEFWVCMGLAQRWIAENANNDE